MVRDDDDVAMEYIGFLPVWLLLLVFYLAVAWPWVDPCMLPQLAYFSFAICDCLREGPIEMDKGQRKPQWLPYLCFVGYATLLDASLLLQDILAVVLYPHRKADHFISTMISSMARTHAVVVKSKNVRRQQKNKVRNHVLWHDDDSSRTGLIFCFVFIHRRSFWSSPWHWHPNVLLLFPRTCTRRLPSMLYLWTNVLASRYSRWSDVETDTWSSVSMFPVQLKKHHFLVVVF